MRLGLLLVMILAGCAAPTDGPAAPSPPAGGQIYIDDLTIAPGGSHEVNVNMSANASLEARLSADGNMTWDVHSHPGGRVRTWTEGRGREADISFTAPEADVYSIWIRSASADTIAVHIGMNGQFVLVP